jgi:outer membrane lipoprotein-sorting protein
MKTFNVILLVSLIGFTSIKASNNQRTSSVAERQSEETITIEDILDGIKESSISFNHSLQDLTVKQTATLKSTLMGEVKIVKQIRFKRPDIIEQKVIEREEKVRSGVDMNLEESVSYTLFTEPLLSSLSPDNYNINLVGKKTIKGRPAYLLNVKPKNKQGDFIDGKLWIDTRDFTLVRFEGKPLKKEDESNVTGGKQIIEYDKIGDKYWLPILNRWKASWVLVIKLVNEITYSQYEINTKWGK